MHIYLPITSLMFRALSLIQLLGSQFVEAPLAYKSRCGNSIDRRTRNRVFLTRIPGLLRRGEAFLEPVL